MSDGLKLYLTLHNIQNFLWKVIKYTLVLQRRAPVQRWEAGMAPCSFPWSQEQVLHQIFLL